MRQSMPVARTLAYFDHAAVAPLPAPAQRAIADWAREAAEAGDTVWPTWAARIEQIRGRAAELFGAAEAEIALVPNTTSGIGLVAEGFPWREGDNVVTLENEFPSNLYPWMNLASRGVETRRVAVEGGGVDLQRVADACDDRTRIVSLSWVGYASGWRIDPAEAARMAHDQGALLFLDAIQGLGVFPLDAEGAGIDFFAADGHKWMLGPEGAGLLYVRRKHLDLLRPLGVGWNSVKQTHDFGHVELDIRPTAARYEGGSQNMPGFHGLGASLDMLAEYGLASQRSAVAERVLAISDSACEHLESAGAELFTRREGDHRSGIVTFRMPGVEPARARKTCLERRVVLSCRGGGLRISTHAYNDQDDLTRLVQALREIST